MSTPPAKPKIAISVGDAAGVGPELALLCVSLPEITERCDPILLGPATLLSRISQHVGLPPAPATVDIGDLSPEAVTPGQYNAATGKASYDAVCRAIEGTLSGEFDAIVTGPIQKEAWQAAGITFPGHTELLAERTGTTDFSMMLTSDEISCVLATIHIALADVPQQLTQQKIERAIRLAADAASRRNRSEASPAITVCGLNPHAGENGMFSHGEESNIIAPAIASARARGINAIGPVSPDTAFTPAMRANTDAYVCMYHDQGLIPLKALSFDDAVNVTLGLPIIRTSVDHGTAMDLAWQGKANHRSMLAAINMAIDLCPHNADGTQLTTRDG